MDAQKYNHEEDSKEIWLQSTRVQWKILNFKRIPEKEQKLFQSSEFHWLNASWILSFSLKDISEPLKSSLSIRCNSKSPLKATIGAYLESSKHILYVTKFPTVEINKDKIGMSLFKYLAEDIERSGHITMKMKRMNIDNADVCISCCLINGIPDDTMMKWNVKDGALSLESIYYPYKEMYLASKELCANKAVNVKYIVKIGDAEFPIDEQLQARSPLIKCLFSRETPPLESDTDILNCTSEYLFEPEVFEDFLKYYFGSIKDLSFQRLKKLYVFCKEYYEVKCKSACITYMAMDIESNLFDVIYFSEEHNVTSLLKCSASYFARHVYFILYGEKWRKFEKVNPKLTIKFLKTVLQDNTIKINM